MLIDIKDLYKIYNEGQEGEVRALDSKTGRHVLGILQQLYREGTTILLITHDDGIAATAPRVVRLSDGKIISDKHQEVDWL